MVKKKTKRAEKQGTMASDWKPPSPGRMMRMSAEHTAQMAMEADPAMKKKRDEIAAAIEETIKQKLGPVRKGRFN